MMLARKKRMQQKPDPLLLIRAMAVACSSLLLACGGGGGGSSAAVAAATSVATTNFQPSTVQEALDHGIDQGVDGLFLHIERADGSIVSAAAGVQDRSKSTPADPAALFKIASISKMFIATAATQLIHQGILAPDDTLAQWLPAIASRIVNGQSITLRNMLQHRSGIPDFDSHKGFSWETSHTDIDRVLEHALDLPADFSPDRHYEYSNTNYLLVAKILDEALGYSHRLHIQSFILDPLGMKDTYHQLSEVDPDHLVRGYWNDRDKTTQDYVIPGGSMISTTRDVAVFLRALAAGDLLSKEEQVTYTDLYWTSHSGWLPGYQSIANYEQGIDAVIVLFLNNTGGNSENILADTYDNIRKLSR
jgi:CubicO group peptidase (beta-lactamase class C family)